MIELSEREYEFLRESNAIEDILNIDYRDPSIMQGGAGHIAAYCDARERARNKAALTLKDLCQWQKWVVEEQLEFRHALPAGGAGVLRSQRYPHNVMVGSYLAPSFEKVPALIDELLLDLNARVASLGPYPEDVDAADAIGTFLQRFEAIHPYVDGNGRLGRLIANYVAIVYTLPPIVFRVQERPAFYRAHRSKLAMRVFIADKIREAIYWPGRGVLERQSVGESSDVYDGIVVERHALLAKVREWSKAENS